MECCPLSSVKQRIALGMPLPFNVRDNDGTLLLACGQVIGTQEQLDALFERGALIDTEELKPSGPDPHDCPAEKLPALWDQTFDRVGTVLKASISSDFSVALDRASAPVSALIQRDPDLAIFQVVRQEAALGAQYGVSHSMHVAIAARLAAQRLGWDAALVQKTFKAALTMNLSMFELQGRLALQTTQPTEAQRASIRSHPLRSVQMLEAAGITDQEWLDGVAQHHEMPDGKGYPMGLVEISDIAALLRRTDGYTAKLSARATRAPMAANDAARRMFVEDQGHPMVAALVKEFGIYPPGCCVRLASGEVGFVIKRGDTANTPVVATVLDKHGDAMLEPVRRLTRLKEHAVVGVLHERTLKVRVSRERLAALASASGA
jgi:hypothetical protein